MFGAVPALSDMGGRTEHYGPVVREPNEPVFHERWEGRVFGMSAFVHALLGRNTDAARFAMERLPREIYLSSYYRRWLGGSRAGWSRPDISGRMRSMAVCRADAP